MDKKARAEVSDKYKWDLSRYFKDSKEFEIEIQNLRNSLNNVESIKGHILESPESLYNALKLEEDIDRKRNKIYVYGNLKVYEDSSNGENTKAANLANQVSSEVSEKLSFINPEILSADYELIKDYINKESKLKDFKFQLESMFRYKEHYLSDKEEKILNSFESTLSTYQSMFSSLIASEIDAGEITTPEGETVKLNEKTLNDLMRHENRNFREKVYKQYWNSYNRNGITLSNLLINSTSMSTKIAKLRGFDSVLDRALFEDNVTKELFNNIINTVYDNTKSYARFFSIIKNKLGVDELMPWDLGVELTSKTVKKYTVEEALEIIKKALAIFGPEYQSVIEKAITERWIDYLPLKNKYLGWFSWGSYDANPVILLNYKEEVSDVTGMAHEIGHAVHDYFAFSNNNYSNSEYPLFVAEIVSLTNELLVSEYIIEHSSDKNEKIQVLRHILNLINGNMFGVTIKTKLEKFIYDKHDNGEGLSDEEICNKFQSLYDECRKNVIKSDKSAAHSWAINTQFFEEYYFYKYAIGMICALTLIDKLKTKEGLESYFNFLKMGDNYPMEELKVLGIDLEDENIIKNAVKKYDSYLDEYEKLLNS